LRFSLPPNFRRMTDAETRAFFEAGRQSASRLAPEGLPDGDSMVADDFLFQAGFQSWDQSTLVLFTGSPAPMDVDLDAILEFQRRRLQWCETRGDIEIGSVSRVPFAGQASILTVYRILSAASEVRNYTIPVPGAQYGIQIFAMAGKVDPAVAESLATLCLQSESAPSQ
jgi:hypothetical protein